MQGSKAITFANGGTLLFSASQKHASEAQLIKSEPLEAGLCSAIMPSELPPFFQLYGSSTSTGLRYASRTHMAPTDPLHLWWITVPQSYLAYAWVSPNEAPPELNYEHLILAKGNWAELSITEDSDYNVSVHIGPTNEALLTKQGLNHHSWRWVLCA